MSRSTANSEAAMVCAMCFLAKGNAQPQAPCQNPKCYFFLGGKASTGAGDCGGVASTVTYSLSVSDQARFVREVGHGRGRRSSSSAALRNSKDVWGYRPDSTTSKPLPGPSSSVTFSSAGVGGGRQNKIRSQSTSDSRRSSLHSAPSCEDRAAMARRMRSRLMSMPLSVEPFSSEKDGALVEDAFMSSPLLTDLCGEEVQQHLSTPDTDSGIGSPFSQPPSILEWPEMRQSSSVCLPQPSSSSSSSSSAIMSTAASTFDMDLLRMEISACKPKVYEGHSSPTLENSVSLPHYSSSSFSSSLPTPSSSSSSSSSSLPIPSSSSSLPTPSSSSSLPSEIYSKKIFVGGLPPEIDEDEIRAFFIRFGSLTVDWPHKLHSKACIPPKGYAFLLFEDESSVHKLLISCLPEGDKLFMYMPTNSLNRKKVQIRPWYTADSQYLLNSSQTMDSRKAVFVGGVPRPLRASELAEVMSAKYGSVVFVAIDCDSELKYPKGAACVVFSSHSSYIAAVSARFMQLNYGSIDKKIEIKPYVLDGQMCDECHGVQCNGKPAPFFCGSVTCLQYLCEHCWATIHSMPSRQNHRPLLKDVGTKFNY